MPDGTKVGDVYVEGRLDYDGRGAASFFSSMQRDMGRHMPNIAASLRDNFSRSMGEAGALSGRNFATSMRAALGREKFNAKVDVDTDGNTIKRTITSAVGSGLSDLFKSNAGVTNDLFEFFRTGVSRSLVSLFSSPAGLAIGGALVAMLGTVIGNAAVFLGAALTSALVAGLGVAAIAGGIALVADDPKIKAAGEKIGNDLMNGLKKAAEPFKAEVLDALKIFEGTVQEIMPRIETIFADLAQHVVPLAEAIDAFINNALPGLERLLTNIDPLIGSLTQGIELLGTKIGEAFDVFADPTTMQAMSVALEDLLALIGNVIVAAAEIAEVLVRGWELLRPHWMEMMTALDDIGINFDLVKNIIIGLIAGIGTATMIITAVAQAIKAAVDGIKAAAQAVADWWTGTLWPSLQTAGEQARGIWDAVRERWNAIWTDIKNDWAAFKDNINQGINEIKSAWASLRDDINARIQDIKNAWMDLRNDINAGVEAIKSGWQSFRDAINSAIAEVKQALADLRADLDSLAAKFTEFRDRAREAFEGMRQAVTDVINSLRSDISARFEEIRSAIVDRVNTIRESVRAGFEDIRAAVSNAVDQIRSNVEDRWNAIRETIERVIGIIRGAVDTGFSSIREAVVSRMNEVRSNIEQALNTVRGIFDQIIGHIQGAVTGAFNAFRDVVRNTCNEINSRLDDLKNRFQQFRDAATARFNEVRDTFRNVWNEVRTQIFDPMGQMISVDIPNKYAEFKDKVIRIFSEVRDTIGRIWNEMLTAAKGAVNSIAGFINGVIKAINQIPFMKDKLGELPGFADGGAVIQGKAKGGPVFGGPPGTDTVPAMGRWGQPFLLDNGEHVLTKRDVSAMGGHDAVYQFRHNLHKKYPPGYKWGGTIGFADGGRVSAGNEGLMQQHKDHVHVAMNVPPMGFPAIIAAAKASGIPHQVGSTFRPGSRGSGGGLDHHSEGRAVDFPGFNQDRFATFWEKLPGVIELIHRTATRDYAIFGGGSSGTSSGGLISWLLSAAGKAVKAAFDKAMSGLKGAIGGDLLKGNTMAPGVLRNMFTNVADQLTSYFDFNAAAGGGGAAAAPEQLKKWIEEAQKYVTIEDVGKLLTLIMRESGGNPRAINLTDSNAQKGTPSKGLMQTIDPTFQAYRDKRLPNDPYDPVANIVAGMNYIHARYGSLNNVQQANANAAPKGYAGGGEINAVRVAMDRAGVIPPGSDAFIRNATSEHEYAMTASHMKDIFGHGDNGDRDWQATVNVYVDGVRRDARIEYDRQARKVANSLRAGGRC